MESKEESYFSSSVEGVAGGQGIQIIDASELFSKRRVQHVHNLSAALSRSGYSIVHHSARQSMKDALLDDLFLDSHMVVLIYEPAQTAIAYLLATGTSPSAALAEWIKTTRALIVLWRKHRRNILLVPATRLQGDLTDLEAAMHARLGGGRIDLPKGPPDPSVDELLYIVLAQQTLAGHLDARHLVGELEAGALCTSGIACDVDRAFGEIAQKTDLLKAMEKQQNDLRKELLRTQTEVTKVQFQLDVDQTRRLAKEEILECELEDVKAQNTLMQHHLECAQSALEESCIQPRAQPDYFHDTERELLEQNRKFHGLKIELEALEQRHINDKKLLEQAAEDIVTSRTEITFLQDTLQQRTAEIHSLRSSNSWKVTSPVRFVKDTVVSLGQKKE